LPLLGHCNILQTSSINTKKHGINSGAAGNKIDNQLTTVLHTLPLHLKYDSKICPLK